MRIIAAVLAGLASTSAAVAEPVTYMVDKDHAIVVFEARHFTTSTTRGLIQAKEGVVVLDPQAKTGKVNVVLDMSTLATAVASQTAFLRGERMFNVAANPTATFESTQVSYDGDKVAAVSGQMTIAGKTRPVSLKATHFACAEHPLVKKPYCGGDFETVVKRSDFGITGLPPTVASDDVRLLIQVEAIQAQ